MIDAINWKEGMEGLFMGLPAEKYHAAPGVSHSMLKNSEPPARLPVYLTSPFEPTVAMVMGTIVHSRILEPDKPLPKLIVRPEKMDFRSKDGKGWRDAQLAKGLCILKQEEFENLGGVIDSLRNHPWCAKVLGHPKGQSEVSGFYHKDGLLRKFRIDYVPDGNFLCDIKTFGREADDAAIERVLYDDRHYTQAAYYLDGWNHLNPDDQRYVFQFFYVEKTPPYLIRIIQLDESDLELGRQRNEKNLAMIKLAQERNYWPSFSQEPQVIKLLQWARYREQDEAHKQWLVGIGHDILHES